MSIGSAVNRFPNKRTVQQGTMQGLQNFAGGLGKGMFGKKKTPLEEAYGMADKQDVNEIEQLMLLLADPQFVEPYRSKAIQKVKDKIAPTSHMLLNLKMKQVSGVQPGQLGAQTWRQPGSAGQIGGQRVPQEQVNRLREAIQGTTKRDPGELALGQLPEAGRMQEFLKRAKAGGLFESLPAGAEQVGRGMVPTGKEGVLGAGAAARQRAMETPTGPGSYGNVMEVVQRFGKNMLPKEKEELIEQGRLSGVLNERGIEAARSFIDRTAIPEAISNLPSELWPAMGIAKSDDGVPQHNLSKDANEAEVQMNLRTVMLWPAIGIEDFKNFTGDQLHMMELVAYGDEFLTQSEVPKVKEGESDLPNWIIQYMNNPLITWGVKDERWMNEVKKLMRYVRDPAIIAGIITMAQDTSIRQAWTGQYGLAK